MSLYEKIKDIDMFRQFTENEKQFFSNLDHSILAFKEGDFIIKEGERNISLYVLIKGAAQITKTGNDSPLATLQPGARADGAWAGVCGGVECRSRGTNWQPFA